MVSRLFYDITSTNGLWSCGKELAETPGSSEVKIVRENTKFDHEQAKKPDKFFQVFE